MKINKLLAGVMSAILYVMIPVLVAIPFVSMVGCTPAQLATFDNTVTTIENHLPQIGELATGLTALVAPEYVPLIGPGLAVITFDVGEIKKLVDGLQTPADGTVLAKIDAFYQDAAKNLQGIVQSVGVKDPQSTAAVNFFAAAFGEVLQFIQDLTAKQPAVTATFIRVHMPNVFGGSVIGMHAIALTGDVEADMVITEMNENAAPAAKVKAHPIHSVRQIAKTWNVLAKNNPKAKIKVPRAKVMGIYIPGTGH